MEFETLRRWRSYRLSTVAMATCVASFSLVIGDSASRAQEANSEPQAKSIVIVHGAWGGSHHWSNVAEHLEELGEYQVHRISLTGLGPRAHLISRDIGLETHIQDVVQYLDFEDLSSVILIGHSYGGQVAGGAAAKSPERISRLICLDSHLLAPGENYLTHHPKLAARLKRRAEEDGDGWLIPVDWKNTMRDVPHPLATLMQPVDWDQAALDLDGEYWLFTDGREPTQDDKHRYVAVAEHWGYATRDFRWGHNPHMNRPKELAQALHDRLVE